MKKTYLWLAAAILILLAFNVLVIVLPHHAATTVGVQPAAAPPPATPSPAVGKTTQAQRPPSRPVVRQDGKQTAKAGPHPTGGSKGGADAAKSHDAPQPMAFMGGPFADMTDEQRTELDELRRNNPQGYAERMQQLMQEWQAKQQAEANAMNDLIENYRSTKSDQARRELLAKLEVNYDRQLQMLEEQIKQMQKNLEDQRARKDATLEKQLEAYSRKP
jgi:hypothetical protein